MADFQLNSICREDEYTRLLQSKSLWPVDPMVEQNWSGCGQHAIFSKDEQPLIENILQVKENLGSTRTAIVQSVNCRRIVLARKTITCGKQTMTKLEAIAEVSHLTRLNHAHIVRIIGTYVKGRELSILLYPVAQYNLETFIEHLQNVDSNVDSGRNTQPAMHLASRSFFSCLSSGTKYIHSRFTKHMDIKPQNILIVESQQRKYHPLIADFGIARSYESQDDIETDGRTSFTKRYAAPEVVKQDPRGLPADIFSLGCVFLEIYISIQCTASRFNDKIHAVLNENFRGDTSYQANARELQSLLNKRFDLDDTFMLRKNVMPLISRMLSLRPHERPTADELVCFFGEIDCCISGQAPLQATALEYMLVERI